MARTTTQSATFASESALPALPSALYIYLQGAFVEHINAVLNHDEFLKEHGYLPIDREGDALFRAMSDGILLWCV